MQALTKTLLRMMALAALALACALAFNHWASASRRLAWAPRTAPLQDEPAPVSPAPAPQAPILPPAAPPPAAPKASRRATTPEPRPVPPPAPPAPVREAVATSPIREISGEEVQRAFQAGVPFLDARRSAEYALGHVPGAFCVPVWEADLEDRILHFEARRQPGPDDPIVIYCSGGGCQDSHLLARKLLALGYHHLLIDRDGFPAWVAQGKPIETGQP